MKLKDKKEIIKMILAVACLCLSLIFLLIVSLMGKSLDRDKDSLTTYSASSKEQAIASANSKFFEMYDKYYKKDGILFCPLSIVNSCIKRNTIDKVQDVGMLKYFGLDYNSWAESVALANNYLLDTKVSGVLNESTKYVDIAGGETSIESYFKDNYDLNFDLDEDMCLNEKVWGTCFINTDYDVITAVSGDSLYLQGEIQVKTVDNRTIYRVPLKDNSLSIYYGTDIKESDLSGDGFEPKNIRLKIKYKAYTSQGVLGSVLTDVTNASTLEKPNYSGLVNLCSLRLIDGVTNRLEDITVDGFEEVDLADSYSFIIKDDLSGFWLMFGRG